MIWGWSVQFVFHFLVGDFSCFFELLCSFWMSPANVRKQQHLQPHCGKTLSGCWGNGGILEGSVRRACSAEASWDDWGKRRFNRRGSRLRLSSLSSAGNLEELWLRVVFSERNRAPPLPAALLSDTFHHVSVGIWARSVRHCWATGTEAVNVSIQTRAGQHRHKEHQGL